MLAEDRVEETGFSFSSHVPMPPERRNDERYLKILRVGTLIVDGRRELCLIRNISAGGVMAHVYSAAQARRAASRSSSRLTSRSTGRIVWVSEANAGIQFDAPIDVAELLANPRGARQWLAAAHAAGRDRPDGDLARRRQHALGPRPRHLAERRQGRDRPAARAATPRSCSRWKASTRCTASSAGAASTPAASRSTSSIPFADLIDWLKQAA